MEDTSSPRSRRAAQREDARSQLLDAAVTQLSGGGLRELTHRKVERRAGLAQGSVKYYFGSLDGLVEALLTHLVVADVPLVLEVSPAQRAHALATGDTSALLARAQQVVDAVATDPDRVRARFHLYLHAASNPRWQGHVARAREEFVRRIAASLPGPAAEAGARFVCAVVDGILLDQLSAPSPVMEQYAASYLLAAGAAGAQLAEGPAPGHAPG